MKRVIRCGLIAAAAMLAAVSASAGADVLVLKNGRSVRGIVRKVGEESVVMDVYMGGDVIRTTFRIDEIRDVRAGDEASIESIEKERAEAAREEAKSRRKAYWRKKFAKGSDGIRKTAGDEGGKVKKGGSENGGRGFVGNTVELMTLGTSTKQLDRTRKTLRKIDRLGKEDRKAASTPIKAR